MLKINLLNKILQSRQSLERNRQLHSFYQHGTTLTTVKLNKLFTNCSFRIPFSAAQDAPIQKSINLQELEHILLKICQGFNPE